MNARALVTALVFTCFAPSIVVAATGTIKTTDDITSEYLVTNAARILNFPASVEVAIDYETTIGKISVTDWTARIFCSKYGPSPNGEPEFAECEEESTAWGPKVQMDTTNTVIWKVADLSGSVSQSDTVDLTRCVRNYEQLEVVQPNKPNRTVPTMTLEKNCFGYAYVPTNGKGVSNVLKGATVDVEVKFGNFVHLNLANDLVLADGRVEEADQALVQKSFSLDPSYTQVIFNPTITRRGQTINLFNFPEVVYFQ